MFVRSPAARERSVTGCHRTPSQSLRLLLLPARWLAFLSFLLCVSQSHAVSQQQLQALSRHPTWLKLGHYQRDASAASGWRSAIHGEDFFLGTQGRVDPLVELTATLQAFALEKSADSDEHAQCRYPARWNWLRLQLGSTEPGLDRRMSCPGLSAWTRSNSVSSVSIVFATGFLANPASFYGHTLLKFNFRGDQRESRLMDVSVNYGAIVGNNEGILTYVVKSVLGGYDGGFSHISFYFHNHNYGDVELRDLWEYQLRLPKDALDRVVHHAWEVLGKRYTYHFFRENCAYRMAELLEVVDGLKVIPQTWPWIIPQELIEHIGAARHEGQPLLADVIYHPSRQSRYYAKYGRLVPSEVDALESFAASPPAERAAVLGTLSVPSQQAVLDTAIDYYQYIGAPIDKAARSIREDYTRALSMRYQLPPAAVAAEPPTLPPLSPHLSRRLGWVQVAAVANRVAGDSIDLRIRPAYYDALDSEAGHVGNSLLTMGDLQFSVRRGRIEFRRLDLLGIESVNPGRTPLKGDGGAAYKLHFGAEPLQVGCSDRCTVVRLQGDYGYGNALASGLFAAGYLGGALQTRRAGEGLGFVRGSVDLIYRLGDKLGLRASLEARLPVGSELSKYSVASVEGRWRIESNTDVRLAFERNRATRVGLGLGTYW
jgi:Domain of unknown function (DUF4105)